MSNENIENEIKNAVEKLTPDVLDAILEKCDGRGNTFIISQRPKRTWIRGLGSVAAALVLIFSGVFSFNRMLLNKVDMLVMLDVNPSVEIEINSRERVVAVEAKNEDAVKILDNMDLKNTQVNVAVNALIGSMLKYGYIHESANSILLSVNGADGQRSADLQKNLSESIGRQLSVINGAVISQSLAADDVIQQKADSVEISYGKAALVQKIIDENSHLLFEDLAGLSVNELNLLAGSKNIAPEDLAYSGTASDQDFIGGEAAEQAAFSHAGIEADGILEIHTELDYDDGIMIYDVEFYTGDYKYEYEVNARDGAVIEYDREPAGGGHRGPRENKENPAQNKKDFIGEDKALEIAKNHSGVKSHAGLEIELDKDDGIYIYEIEFGGNGSEYDYEINATTGEVISFEADD